MDYRTLLVAAALTVSLVPLARADMVAVDNGIAVKQSDVATPRRGMTMDQVASKFGAPVTKVAAVGKPPISRWEYPGFVVYFERDYVIDSVIGAAPSEAPPASETPPASVAPAPAN
jgi:hypothetical protein